MIGQSCRSYQFQSLLLFLRKFERRTFNLSRYYSKQFPPSANYLTFSTLKTSVTSYDEHSTLVDASIQKEVSLIAKESIWSSLARRLGTYQVVGDVNWWSRKI